MLSPSKISARLTPHEPDASLCLEGSQQLQMRFSRNSMQHRSRLRSPKYTLLCFGRLPLAATLDAAARVHGLATGRTARCLSGGACWHSSGCLSNSNGSTQPGHKIRHSEKHINCSKHCFTRQLRRQTVAVQGAAWRPARQKNPWVLGQGLDLRCEPPLCKTATGPKELTPRCTTFHIHGL